MILQKIQIFLHGNLEKVLPIPDIHSVNYVKSLRGNYVLSADISNATTFKKINIYSVSKEESDDDIPEENNANNI